MLLNMKQQQSRGGVLFAFTSLTATLTLAASLVTLYPVAPAQAKVGPGGLPPEYRNRGITLDIEDEQPFTYNSASALYTTTANLHVTATKPYGFNLTMQATSNALTNTLNSSHQIPSLTTNNQALGTNQWGYTLTNTNPNKLSSSSRFNPIPTVSTVPATATILDVAPANPTHSSNTNPSPCTSLTNCTTKVLYAANLNPATLPTGTYQTTITYTVTAKPAPKPVVPNSICRSGDTKSDCKVDLDKNLIPVIYTGDNNNAQWTSIKWPENPHDPGAWYDYGKKQWANAVTVKDPSKYQGKRTVVSQDDILGFWVYVPRYAYEVMRRDGTDKPVPAQNFLIQFEKTATPKRVPAACPEKGKDYRTECGLNRDYIKGRPSNAGTWATHPAFTFGKKELNGIWFAKFETTGTNTQPTVLPNEAHMSGEYDVSHNIGRMYTTAKTLGVADSNNIGGDTDYAIPTQNNHHLAKLSSHMVNNNDWGAAAYLSASKYGAGYSNVQLNAQVKNEPDFVYTTTGCGPMKNGSIDYYGKQYSWFNLPGNKSKPHHYEVPLGARGTQQACSSDGTHAYNASLGQLASTTNNPTGIYDMSGGGYEYTAASYATNLNESGVSDAYGDYFGAKAYPPYVNTYNFSDPNSCTFATCGGQALYETNNGSNIGSYQWNGNYMGFVTSSLPWFRRGGGYSDGSNAGLFSASDVNGFAYGDYAFRVALTPPLQN